jgi:hypothetical protein
MGSSREARQAGMAQRKDTKIGRCRNRTGRIALQGERDGEKDFNVSN